MEIRIYKVGETKKIDIRDTSFDEILSFGKFVDVVFVAKKANEVDLYVSGEKRLSGIPAGVLKDFSGNTISAVAGTCADKSNAILAVNREVDSYIIGDDLSQKSETTEFVHNDSINNGAAVVLKTQNFKAGVEGNYIEADSTGSNGYIDFYVEVGGNETSHKAFRIYGGSLTQTDARIDFLDTTIENLSITSLTEVPASLGSAGQVLAVNSGGTALEFVAQSGGGGGGLGGADQTLTADRTIDLDSNVLTIDDGSTDLMKVSSANGVQVFGDFSVDSGAVTGASIKLEEADLLGNNFIEIKAPISVTANTTLTLPDGAGTSGQVLTTNGISTLSWGDSVAKVNPVVENVLSINTISSASSPRIAIEGADGLGYVYFKVPDATSTNTLFTLPDTDGTSGQALTTDGSGTLTFTTVGGGGGSVNELDGIYLEVVTRSSAYGAASFEGQVVKFGTGTLSAGKIYVLRDNAGAALWDEADADAEIQTKGLLGMALGTSPTTDGLLVRGIRSFSNSFTVGAPLYISLTAGTLTDDLSSHTTGDFVRAVGYSLSTTLIYLDPSPDYIELA